MHQIKVRCVYVCAGGLSGSNSAQTPLYQNAGRWKKMSEAFLRYIQAGCAERYQNTTDGEEDIIFYMWCFLPVSDGRTESGML